MAGMRYDLDSRVAKMKQRIQISQISRECRGIDERIDRGAG
jgi:hypothetical protein